MPVCNVALTWKSFITTSKLIYRDPVKKFELNLFRNQLITRQDELEIILHNYTTTVEFIDEESQSDIVEEYIDDSDGFADESNQSLVEMPSVKNLKQPSSTDIVKLIEDIEKRNQMIFESSKPTVAIRKRSVKKKEMKSNVHKDRMHIKHAVRNEAIKVEKLEPKLILKPVINKAIEMATYDREKYSCSNCQEKFPSQFLLKRHMAKAHPLEKPMVCCDQVFKFNHDYKQHLANCPSKNAVVCSMCNKVLKNKKTFQIHLKSHLSTAERKFKCNYNNCTKSFNIKIHLENHLRMHKKEKCFQCPQCSIAFKQKHQVAIHVKRKH